MAKAERALIIFIRNPELGKVKTRLANGVGQQRALEIYKALLAHTREVALQVESLRLLFYSQNIQESDEWPSESFTKLQQEGNGLGERMENAFRSALSRAEKAVIVGSDIAQIQPKILEDAFRALEESDYVIGPALDGGYYLLGMKQESPALFRGMEWSTPAVFEHTVKRIEAAGYNYALADTLSDIDYAEDWQEYGWEL